MTGRRVQARNTEPLTAEAQAQVASLPAFDLTLNLRTVQDDPPFVPGTYVVTFDRIGAHRPAPLTVAAAAPEDLEAGIRKYADLYTRSGEIMVCVEPPLPGRSVAGGWITAGSRDAGGFTWKPAP